MEKITLPEKYSHLTIDETFEKVIDTVINKQENLFITGEAGTGKSELLKILSDEEVNGGKQSVVLSTTGVSASNIGGMTVHSFFKLPPEPIMEHEADHIVDKLKTYNTDRVSVYNALDLLFIDESSMLKPYHVDVIDRILRLCKSPTKPFGGTQVIFIGDLFQLEPIVNKGEQPYLDHQYNGIPFFFSAKAFQKEGRQLDVVELKTIYRQKDDKEFSEILRRIRKAQQTPEDIAFINKAVVSAADFYAEDDYVYLATKNDVAERENKVMLDMLEYPTKKFEAEMRGDVKQSILPHVLEIKKDAQVMLLKNFETEGLYNGSIGIVENIVEDEDLKYPIIYVRFNTTGRVAPITPVRLDFFEYTYNKEEKKITKNIIGSIEQYPLKLGYALTIHKSQGLTLDRAYVDFGSYVFACGQAYVALSRVRNIKTLGLKRPLKIKDIKVNKHLKQFI